MTFLCVRQAVQELSSFINSCLLYLGTGKEDRVPMSLSFKLLADDSFSGVIQMAAKRVLGENNP